MKSESDCFHAKKSLIYKTRQKTPPMTTSDDTTNESPQMKLFREHLACPVCSLTFTNPISFRCGHSLCESCSLAVDIDAIDRGEKHYDCSVCGVADSLPWHLRPRNVTLARLVDVAGVAADHNRDERLLLCVRGNEESAALAMGNAPAKCDLPTLCRRSRAARVELLARHVEDITADSAEKGYSRISINTRAKELCSLSREIATRLFRRGVHSVTTTPREFTVYIVPPESGETPGSFVNVDYVDEAAPISADD